MISRVGWLSGEYAALLKKRALSMLALAKRLLSEGQNDLAALNAEYAAQLYLKALLYRVSGEEWRGHGIRALLGALSAVLEGAGFREEAEMIMDYVRGRRRALAELEEAHTRAVYGVFEYDEKQAAALVSLAEEVIELLRKVEEGVIGD